MAADKDISVEQEDRRSMTGIDELSATIGRLVAQVEEGNRQRDRLFDLVEEVKEDVACVKKDVDMLRTEFAHHADTEKTLDAKVDRIGAAVEAAGLTDKEIAESTRGVAKAWMRISDAADGAAKKVLSMFFVAAILAGATAIGVKISGSQ